MAGDRSNTAVRRTEPIAVLLFVVLGLSSSCLGTAWPSLRRDVGRPVADLGALLAAGLVGYMTASTVSGQVTRRIGVAPGLLGAAGCSLAGLAGFATASGWAAVLASAVTLGIGGGLIDSSVNAYAAHRFTPGATNLLHAGFGVGATIGPVLMARAVASGAGWHAGYVVIAAAEAVMLGVLWVTRARWRPEHVAAPHRDRVRPGRVVVLSLLMFFLYTGVEVAAGQWSFSVVGESRGLDTDAAGAWVASYWGGLTAGRLALGTVASRLGAHRVLGLSMGGTAAGCALFWWDPGGLGVTGLPVIGLSLAGIFPTLVTLTPQRIGAGQTTAMMGYQLAAASLGAAVFPWLVGLIVAHSSLEALGPVLVAGALAMAVLHVALDIVTRPAPAQVT